MGLYINPPDSGKEDWLEKETDEVTRDRLCDFIGGGWSTLPEGKLPVVMALFLMHTAAVIATGPGNLEYYLGPENERPKKYFLVDKEKLCSVSPLKNWLETTAGKRA